MNVTKATPKITPKCMCGVTHGVHNEFSTSFILTMTRFFLCMHALQIQNTSVTTSTQKSCQFSIVCVLFEFAVSCVLLCGRMTKVCGGRMIAVCVRNIWLLVCV